jgi:uncharacterized protein (TIGR03435 family)
MKRPDDLDKVLKDVLHSTPKQEMEAAGSRVLQRLRSQQEEREEVPEPVRALSRPGWRYFAVAGLAAAMVLLAVVFRNSILSDRVIAQATDSGLEHIATGESLQPGQPLHTNTGASLKLVDGSRVEMRAHSDIELERANDGIRIRLKDGAIIVNAASQGSGHLYVQTKDVTVSVVGTVFLVGAEKTGSQVAVIEGEVRVEQGATMKKLLPGEKVATSPTFTGPVQEAISWSRNAESHLALLQETTVAAQRGSRFVAVSIRPMSPERPISNAPNAPTPEPEGFGCHGIDGTTRSFFGGGGGVEIPIPLGRCVGNGINFMWLMNYAYGTPWRFGPGIPEWARSEDDRERAYFSINAVAENPETVTVAQLRAMLQTMLADRFNVQLHRETQTLMAYVFHVAKNGPKLKEFAGDSETPRLTPGIGLHGKTTLDALARFMTDFVVLFVNAGNIDTPFINKTGLTSTYDYAFFLRPGGPRGGGARGQGDPNSGPPTREQRISEFAADLSESMEQTVGIRLDTEKLPVEVIIIDHVEKPTEN